MQISTLFILPWDMRKEQSKRVNAVIINEVMSKNSKATFCRGKINGNPLNRKKMFGEKR